ncbi:MAG: YkgJ family cysteine cluster protein [Litorilinea sp.]
MTANRIPTEFACRVGCGACCIAPSISSPIPGMPHGKPAGVRCVQLTADNRCALFGLPERPAVCTHLRPTPEMCHDSAAAALIYLTELEAYTAPPRAAEGILSYTRRSPFLR